MKIFTILLILVIVGLGLALAEPPPSKDTLPPTNQLQIQPQSGSPLDVLKNLTVPCQNAIIDFVGNTSIGGNTTACLPVNDIIAFLFNPNFTIAIGKFASEICPGPRCNATLLQLGNDLISKGCDADIKNNQKIPLLLLTVIAFYTPLTEILCFKDITNSSFCIVDTLTTINKLPDPNPPIIRQGLDKVLFSPPPAFCTECNQRISKAVTNEIILPSFLPGHNASKTLLLAVLDVKEELLLQLPISVMIKCRPEFLRSNNFTDICQNQTV